MSEWWTYSLADFQMYSASTFTRLLESYHSALFPAQAPALALGLGLAWVAWRGSARQLRLGLAALGGCWLWIAYAWFWQRLADIDTAAPYFAHAFAIQGALLLAAAFALRDDAPLAPPPQRIGAALLIAVALIVMPLALRPGEWGTAGVFGLAPDATAIVTLGFVAALGRARWLLAMPLLWCAASGAMLWNLGFPYPLAVPVLGATALVIALKDPA